MPPVRGMRCAFGKHAVKGQGVQITDPKIIRFIKKMFPSFWPQQRVCPDCKRVVERIYHDKYSRALYRKRHQLPAVSSTSTSSTSEDIDISRLIQSQGLRRRRKDETSGESTDHGPSTSAAAKARREARRAGPRSPPRRRTNTRRMSSECSTESEESQRALDNHQRRIRNVRMPEVQPVVRTARFVQLNRDVMELYLARFSGG